MKQMKWVFVAIFILMDITSESDDIPMPVITGVQSLPLYTDLLQISIEDDENYPSLDKYTTCVLLNTTDGMINEINCFNHETKQQYNFLHWYKALIFEHYERTLGFQYFTLHGINTSFVIYYDLRADKICAIKGFKFENDINSYSVHDVVIKNSDYILDWIDTRWTHSTTLQSRIVDKYMVDVFQNQFVFNHRHSSQQECMDRKNNVVAYSIWAHVKVYDAYNPIAGLCQTRVFRPVIMMLEDLE
eukprot:UN04580